MGNPWSVERKPKRPRVDRICEACSTPFQVKASVAENGGGRFCCRACKDGSGQTRKTLEEKVWPNVVKTDSYWLWTGGPVAGYYGTLMVDGKRTNAHRVVWEMLRGPVPEGLLVCHNCPGGDNPRCVNPDHMFIGT